MGTNLVNYIGNLGKSVGYATIEKFKKISPTTTEFVDTNVELYKSVSDAIIDYKNTYKRADNLFRKSKIYEAGDVYFKSIMEDISTGKFYNKERQSEMDERALGMSGPTGGTDLDWGSFDMGGFDDSAFDIGNEDDGFGSFTAGDEMVASSVERSGKANANAVSKAVARTGEYVVQNQRMNTNIIMTQNMQQFGNMNTSLNAINENIGKVIQFSNNVLQTHADNSQKFYESTTKLITEQTSYLRVIAEGMNGGKKEEEKQRERITIDDILGTNGAPNLGTYAKQVQKNFKNITSGFMPDMGMEGNTLLTLVAQPLAFIPNMIVNKLVPKMVEDSITAFDKSLGGLFGGLMAKANTMGKSDNFIQSTIGKLFGVSNAAKTDIDTSTYNKDRVYWDGKSKKALEEVIPTHLSRIESLLSGKGEKRYDYDKGTFLDAGSLKESFKGIEKNYINKSSDDMRDQFSKYMNLVSFNKLDEKEEFNKDIDRIFKYLYKNNEIFDVNNKNFDDLSMKYGVNGKNLRIFRRLFKSAPNDVQMNLNRNIMENRQAQTNHMDRLEKEGSVYSNLFNGAEINEFVNKHKKTGEVTGKGLLGGLGGNLNSSLDEKGHNIFYYLRNINRELSFMRKNGSLGTKSSHHTSSIVGSNGKVIPLNFDNFDNENIQDESKPTAIRKYNDQRQRDEASYTRQQERAREKNKFMVNFSEIDDDKHADFRLRDAIDLTKTKEKIKEEREKQKKSKDKTIIEELLESDSLIKKYRTMKEKGSNILKKPMDFLSNVFKKADQRMYEMIYGREDGKGFMDLLVENTKATFKRLNTWIDDKILEPLKKKLDVQNFRDLGKKFFGMFGIDTDDFGKRFKTYFFGNKETGEHGLFSDITAGMKESFGSVKNTIKDAVSGTFKDITKPFKDKFKNRKKAIKELDEENNNEGSGKYTYSTKEPENKDPRTETQKILDKLNGVDRDSTNILNDDKKKDLELLFTGGDNYKFYNDKYNQNNSSISSLQSELSGLNDKYKPTVEKIKSIDAQISKNNNSIKNLEETNKSLSTYLKTLKDDNKKKDIQSRISKNQTTIRKIKTQNSSLQRMRNALNQQLSKSGYSNRVNDINSNMDKYTTENQGLNKFRLDTLDKFYEQGEGSKFKNILTLAGVNADEFGIENMENVRNQVGDLSQSSMADLISKFRDGNFGDIANKLDDYNEKAINPRYKKGDKVSLKDISKFGYEKMEDKPERDLSGVLKDNRELIELSEESSDYLKDIRDFLFELKDKFKPKKRKSKIITDISSIAPVFDPTIDTEENNVMWDKSKGLADVIMKFLSGNLGHHKEGTPVLKEAEVATLKEGEMILNPEQVKLVTGLMDSITGRVQMGKDKLSDIATDNYNKFSRIKEATGFKFNELDNMSDENKKLLEDGGFDFKKLQGLVSNRYTKLMDALEKQFKLDTDLDENGEPKDPIQKALYESVKPFTFQMLDEFKNGVKTLKTSLFGDNEKNNDKAFEKAIGDISDNISQYAPKALPAALIGGGVSLLTGMIGGPILGAAVGAGTSIVMNSDKVQDWLFGDKIDDERVGNGVISKSIMDSFKKYFPDATKYGITGAIAGMITPLGPLGGILLGAGASFAKNNASVQDLLFGEKGLFDENAKEKIKKILPRVGLGVLAGVTMGPFGLVGNAMLGAGAGFLTTSNKFRDTIIGKYNENTKQYEDGILPALRETILDPLRNFGGDMKDKFFNFLDKDIFEPLRRSMDPFKKDAKLLVNGLFRVTGKVLDSLFNRVFHTPFSKFAHDLTSKLSNLFLKKIGGTLLNWGGKAVSAPFKAIGKLGDIRRGKHVLNGEADYMTAQERLDFFKNHGNGLMSKVLGKKERKLGKFDEFLVNGDASSISDLQNAFGSFMDLNKSDKKKTREISDETIEKLSPYLGSKDLGTMLKMFKKGASAEEIKNHKATSMNNSKATMSKIFDETHKYYAEAINKIYKKAEKKNLSDKEVNILKIQLRDDIKKRYLSELPSNTQKEILDKLEASVDSNGNIIKGKTDDFHNHIAKLSKNIDENSNTMDNNIDEQFSKLETFKKNKNDRTGVTKEFSDKLKEFGIKIDMKDPRQLEKAYNMLNKEMDRVKHDQKMEEASSTSNEEKKEESPWDTNLAFSKVVEEENKNRHKDITSLFMQTINGLRQMNGQEPLKINTDFNHTDTGDLEKALTRATDGVNGFKSSSHIKTSEGTHGSLAKLGFASASMNNNSIPSTEPDKDGIIRKVVDGKVLEYKQESDGNWSPNLSDKDTKEYIVDERTKKKGDFSSANVIENILDNKKKKKKDKEPKEKKSGGILDTILSFLGGGLSSLALPAIGIMGVGLLSKTKFGKQILDGLTSAIGGILEKATPVVVNLFAEGVKAALPAIFAGIGGIAKAGFKSLFPEIFGKDDPTKESVDNSPLGNGVVRGVIKGNEKGFSNIAKTVSLNEGKGAANIAKKVIFHPFISAGRGLLGGAAKIGEKASSLVNKFTSPVNTKLSKISSSLEESATKKLSPMLEKAYSFADNGIIKSFLGKFEKFLTELVTNPVVSKILGSKVGDIIEKFIPRLTQTVAENAAKDAAKISAKVASIATTGGLATVGFAVWDFVSGYNDAENIYGVSDGDLGIGYKIMAGFVKAINGAFIITSFIPEEIYMQVFYDYLLPIFGLDNGYIKEKRDAAKKELEDYNKKNGTNYNQRQYNHDVKGNKTLAEKSKFSSKLEDAGVGDTPEGQAYIDKAKKKENLGWWDNVKDNASELGNQISTGYHKFTNWITGKGGEYPTSKSSYLDDNFDYTNSSSYKKGQKKTSFSERYTGMGGPVEANVAYKMQQQSKSNNSDSGITQTDVKTNDDFLKYMVPAAQNAYSQYGIYPSIMMAQAINESGWGKSNVAKNDNNLFGIKIPGNHDPSSNATQGSYATDDGGYYAHYPSWTDSIKDHGYFLKNNSRYAKAFEAKSPQEQIQAIKDAGYASAPDYVSTTMDIVNSNNLTQYDSGLSYTGSSSAGSNSSNTKSSGNAVMDLLDIFGRAAGKVFGINDSSSSSGSSSSGDGTTITVKNAPDVIKKAIEFAVSKVGCPYVWGGTGAPLTEDIVNSYKGTDHDITRGANWKDWIGKEGYDCSGLVSKAYESGGQNIGRNTTEQVKNGESVSLADIQPGDLLFYGGSSSPDHVAMCIGNGKMVQAPSSGKTVCISDISSRTASIIKRIVKSDATIETELNSSSSSDNSNNGVGGERSNVIDFREIARKKKNKLKTPYSGVGGVADSFFANTLKGNVTSEFGYRNTSGTIGKNHTGIDIGAPEGQNIEAPIGGVVTKKVSSDKSNGLGNLVVMKDKFGGDHMFGHMKNPSNLKPGDTVDPGEKIGNIGSTGNSTGSHLHYETRVNGQPVNPNAYLKNAKNIGGENDNQPLNSDKLDTVISYLKTIADNTLTLNIIVKLIQALVGNKGDTTTQESNITAQQKDTMMNTGKQLSSLLQNNMSKSGNISESDLYALLAQISS